MRALLLLVLAFLATPLLAVDPPPVPDPRLSALETRLDAALRERDAGRLNPDAFAAFSTPFRAELRTASREVPQIPVNVALVSRLYARLGDGPASLSSLDAALQQSPGDPTLLRAKSLALFESGDRRGASAIAREVYAASGNTDRAAYALINLAENRAPDSVRLDGVRPEALGVTGAPGPAGEDARPAVLAMHAVRTDLLPPPPVGNAPIAADATTADIAKAAFATAATAAGGLLLFMGLGGSVLEERFPNIRRNMGVGVGLAGVLAAGIVSLPGTIAYVSAEVPVALESARRFGQRIGGSFERVVESESGAINPSGPVSATARQAIWSSGKVGDATANAFGHWSKHQGEFPELQNVKQYVDSAWRFMQSPPAGTLIRQRGGETLFYNPTSNTLLIRAANGVPKTMYRPDVALHGRASNLAYFYEL